VDREKTSHRPGPSSLQNFGHVASAVFLERVGKF
jgi:hypothetical protein